MKTPFLVPSSLVLFALAGCTTPAPEAALPAVQQQVADRSDLAVTWPLTAQDRTQAQAAVRDLLGSNLTADSAVRIALLNNRHLRATFEELGLSQVGLAAASRLPNPSLDASVRWPDSAPRGPNVEFGLTAPLLESLWLPTRRHQAEDQLAAAQFRVAHEVLGLAADVRRAWFELLARQDVARSVAEIVTTQQAAVDFAQRQFEAGNLPQLRLAEIETAAQQARVTQARAATEVAVAREALNRLLGLDSSQAHWILAGSLPALPESDALPGDLEAVAQRQRLDLAALHRSAEIAGRALEQKRRTRVLPVETRAGIDTERDPDGTRLTGPRVSLALPLFDQGQPEVARLAAEARRADDLAAALSADIGSEVRTATLSLAAAREAADYAANTVLPHQRASLEEALRHYNAMDLGVYDLLAAKTRLQEAEQQGILALRDYWIARTDLERALGQRLPAAAANHHVEPKNQES